MTASTLEPLAPIAAPEKTAPRRPARHLRWLLLALGVVCAVLWLAREPLLSGFARAYIVDDRVPDHVDAIVVLGGGMAFRPTEAARIYRGGVASRIVVSFPAATPPAAMGIVPPEGEIATALLVRLGVPPAVIDRLEPEVTSTYEEAVAIRSWAIAQNARTVLVPTDIFHTRRVKWVLEKVLRGSGIDVRVTAIDPLRYSPHNWWRREEGVNAFQQELVKLLYYWVRY